MKIQQQQTGVGGQVGKRNEKKLNTAPFKNCLLNRTNNVYRVFFYQIHLYEIWTTIGTSGTT